MKKFLVIAISLILIVMSVAGCSSSSAPESKSPGQEEASASGEKIILKLGDTQADDHPHGMSHYYFAERVAELTNGRVEVQVFNNSALGNHRDMIEGIKLGTVHVTKCMATDLSAYFPEIQLFGLPYMFSDRAHMFRVIDGEIGDYFANEVLAREDFIGIAWFDAGSRCVYNAKRPINSVEDMKGLLLRVPENPIYMSAMDAFGATGTPMPMGDIYTALQTGVIDGAENAPAVYSAMKHFEAAPYFSHTDHIMTPDIIIMKKSYLESLPEDIQEAILTAAKDYQEYERELWLKSENEYVEQLKKDGAKFNEVDKSGFLKASESVWADYVDVIGQDLIDKVQALK
ncbi:MAG: TRAP transporter substrate-binding protein [Thermoanaerobacteraceae bacterium]|nr:TRAP transporter substrate-binding protein [Thermoanaerobacteraceae bacterium]